MKKKLNTSQKDGERMKGLTFYDFKKIGVDNWNYYWSFKTDKYEVCLEPCLNGYDVAIYDLDQNLIGEKTCTNIPDIMKYSKNVAEFLETVAYARKRAVEIANKKLTELFEGENESTNPKKDSL